jgi:hypothetical protein
MKLPYAIIAGLGGMLIGGISYHLGFSVNTWGFWLVALPLSFLLGVLCREIHDRLEDP